MKKIKTLVLSILVVLLSACSLNKEAIDVDKFKEKMRDKDYYVVNSKEQFSEYDYIIDSYIAINSDKTYQIEFYKLLDIDNSLAFYNYNKDIFDASRTSNSTYTDINLSNNNKYTLSTEDSYKVLSRIDDTVIYVNTDIKYKDEINSILKNLGY